MTQSAADTKKDIPLSGAADISLDLLFEKLSRVEIHEAMKIYHKYWYNHSELEVELKKVGWSYRELYNYYNSRELLVD